MLPDNDNMSPKFKIAAELRKVCLAYNDYNRIIAGLPMEQQNRFTDVTRRMGDAICSVHDEVENGL